MFSNLSYKKKIALIVYGFAIVIIVFVFITISSLVSKNPEITTTLTQETLNNLSVIAPITVNFKGNIAENEIIVETTPKEELLLEIDHANKVLTIKPAIFWKPKVNYQLKISDKQNGKILYMLNFTADVSYNNSHDEPVEAPAERANPL